jgi:hypothetical protein
MDLCRGTNRTFAFATGDRFLYLVILIPLGASAPAFAFASESRLRHRSSSPRKPPRKLPRWRQESGSSKNYRAGKNTIMRLLTESNIPA